MDINKFNDLMKSARRAGNREDWQVFNDIVNQLYQNEDLSEHQRKVVSDLELSFLDDDWQRFKPAKDEEVEDLVSIHSDKIPDESPARFEKKQKKEDVVVEFHSKTTRCQDKSVLRTKLEEFVQKERINRAKIVEEEENSEFAGMSLAKRAARKAAARKEAKKKLEEEIKLKKAQIEAKKKAKEEVKEPCIEEENSGDDEKLKAADEMHKAALEGAEKAAKMKKEQKQQELDKLTREQQEQEKLRQELAAQEKESLAKIAKEKAEAERLSAEQKALEEKQARDKEQYKEAFALFKKASVQPKTQGEKIIELCTKAIEIYPEYDEAYFLRASIYDDRKEHDNQIADLSKVVQILRQKEMPNKDKALSKVFKKLGKVFVSLNDWDNAIKSYSSILKYDPESQSAYLNRGLIWQEMQVMDKALADFESAIKINPDKVDPYMLSSKILIENEEYEKAVDYLSKVHEFDPENVDVMYDRGECYYKIGDFKKAINDFEVVYNRRPRDIVVLSSRAQAFIKMREWEEAEEELTKIIQIDPENIDAYKLRIEVYKKLGKKEEAKLDTKRFRKLESDRQAELG